MLQKLLVVDDDTALLVEMAELLTEEGYNVTTAEDGKQALSKMDSDKFDIVFTDLKMPGMNGIDLLKEIKKAFPETFVVMITGFATVDTAVEAMKEGAFDYIRKPFQVEQLRDLLGALGQKRAFEDQMTSIGTSSDVGETGETAFDQFVKFSEGKSSLVLTPNPAQFEGHLDVTIVKVSPMNDPEVISPRNIYKLKETIREYLADTTDPVVFLDCLHEVLMIHEPQVVKDFVTKVTEDVLQEDGQLLLSITPDDTNSEIYSELKRIVSRTYIQVMSDSLSNPIRRDVVRFLKNNTNSNFSAILNYLQKVESAKLSFHLQKLISDGIIGKNDKKQYLLTRRGEKAYDIIVAMEDEGVKDHHNLVTLRYRGSPEI